MWMLWCWDVVLLVMNSERVELEAIADESCINGVVIDLHGNRNAEFKHSANIAMDKGQLAEEGNFLF